jgi:2-dehydro-3-deoxyglucarate aldolase/4-hydroxy-2-oxoheptanedioate aldolase
MEAVENLDDILEVDGLDGIFIGPVDLASSMGYLGDPSQPAVQETIRLIESKVLPSDKFLGTLAPTWEKASACFEKGYQWLVLLQDGAALKAAGDAAMANFRKNYGDS